MEPPKASPLLMLWALPGLARPAMAKENDHCVISISGKPPDLDRPHSLPSLKANPGHMLSGVCQI